MKKIMIPFLALLMVLATVSPTIVKAQENEKVIETLDLLALQEEITKVEFDVIESDEPGIKKINMNYEGKDSITVFNENTGEVTVDGELVAIITRDGQDFSEGSEIYSDLSSISALASSAPYYTIGDNNYGSGFFKQMYSDQGTIQIIATIATVISIAAIIASLFFEYLKKAELAKVAQIVSAASLIFSLIASENLALTWKYVHYKDLDRSAWYMDTLALYQGSTIDSSKLKVHITHYFGNLF